MLPSAWQLPAAQGNRKLVSLMPHPIGIKSPEIYSISGTNLRLPRSID
jgi:hypothetical protein